MKRERCGRRKNPRSAIRNPQSARRAFTLVEMLMVIAIIGMLAGLLIVAASRAVGTARQSQIVAEISSLDTAMQKYANDVSGGSYPPDMSIVTTAPQRQNRILVHVRRAYPRFNPNTFANFLTSPYVNTNVASNRAYASLQNGIIGQFQTYPGPASYAAYSVVANGNGNFFGDIDNLDPAEALVFWMGGPPAPPVQAQTSSGIVWSFKLLGFSDNVQNPFVLTGSRDPGPFEFVSSRLGDADGDGWPEYYPPYGDVAQFPVVGPLGGATVSANPSPPYVYFDGQTYSSVYSTSFNSGFTSYPPTGTYPAVTGAPSQLQPNVAQYQYWGIAAPYVARIAATGGAPTLFDWVNPQKFQIISGGLDQRYSYDEPSTMIPTAPTNFRVLFSLPPYGNVAANQLSQGDTDNVSNFTTGRLMDAQP